ncbi:RagB/SusD family nutrient uptake outer membrane protein [Flavihumibacter sp. UBA7668]|uniref:RagB/SusD family nutrient uptake outer membrane protein n=1 Tax=Flavihumibacter sp. UBA7668 TaxID=1946542 RepID=UPI0025C14FF8|nr:RagB/SusD family nutrient uptake outer membrane protein [Flavihumibacter sp. UBA7668]
MNKKSIIIAAIVAATLSQGCKKFLDVEPLDRVPASRLLTDISGIKVLLANLYIQMPVEDFVYNPGVGFNYHRTAGSGYIEPGFATSFYTDESTLSAGSGVGPVNDNFWAYASIRQVNQLLEQLPDVEMPATQRAALESEAHFIRAYYYFGMAKRYGGVPLIEGVQEYISGSDNENLYVPRSTEKDTWMYILSELDKAIANLPGAYTAVEGNYRATKWAALGLKSRVALHAASIAKFWNKAPLTGQAVDEKLTGGMTMADADFFYQQCIDASLQVIQTSGKALYKPSPSNRAEAAKNFQDIFQSPNLAEVEVLFKKGYIDGTTTLLQGHSTDVFFNPSQTNPGGLFYGRWSPTLDLVDLFEDYSDDGQGKAAPLVTREDGNETEFVSNPRQLNLSIPYKKYTNLTDIFANKDARLQASIITPGSSWKGVQIIMQGGLIAPDGSTIIYADGSATGQDGKTYYSYGAAAPSGYSGFLNLGSSSNQNFSNSGFLLKKFLQEGKNVAGTYFSSTTDYIDMRIAEIMLNYAEAVIESGKGDPALAATYLNALRKRAGHTDNIPATIENILKERRVELAFEGSRYWDLVRRRDFHDEFQSARRKALVPILDLRGATPQYIFVRANNYYDEVANGRNFQMMSYYKGIPGISSNRLIQNPQY